MKQKAIFLLLLGFTFLSSGLFAQGSGKTSLEKLFPKNAKNYTAFTPVPWQLRDKAQGDLNGDGFEDLVLVLNHPQAKSQSDDGFDYGDCEHIDSINPMLVILFRQPDSSFTLSLVQQGAIFRKECGGMYGDPYAGIAIKDRAVVIDHYGGSNWRWSYTDTFRWQNNQWLMIGHTKDEMFATEPEENYREDHNLSTGKFMISKETPKKNQVLSKKYSS